MDAFKDVAKYFVPKEVNTEGGIFRLFSRVSVALCLLGAVLCGLNTYFGQPITCWHGKDEPEDYFNQYCWLHGSSHIPEKYHDHFGCRAEESSDGTKFDTQYYIWVIPFLLVQCSFFMIPHFIWKMAERGLVKEFETTEANSSTIASDKERLNVVLDRFVSYFTSVMRQNTIYFAKFVLCELLNVVVLAFNFYITNAFFSNKWGRYGFKVIDYYQHTALERQSADAPLNPMCNIFPTVVSCDLKTIGTSGGEQNWNGLCILSQNIINQWIFLVLYFWYVLLFVLSAVYILYRISTIALPQLRALTLKVKVNEGTGQHGTVNRVLGRCDIGDWFLLEQLGQNVNPRFFREFLKRLENHLYKRNDLEDVDCGANDDTLPLKSIHN